MDYESRTDPGDSQCLLCALPVPSVAPKKYEICCWSDGMYTMRLALCEDCALDIIEAGSSVADGGPNGLSTIRTASPLVTGKHYRVPSDGLPHILEDDTP